MIDKQKYPAFAELEETCALKSPEGLTTADRQTDWAFIVSAYSTTPALLKAFKLAVEALEGLSVYDYQEVSEKALAEIQKLGGGADE